jgi:putative transposase
VNNVFRTTAIRISLHTLWPVAIGSPELTPDSIERLVSYATRYAQTLGIAVYGVGGTNDHLHLLVDLPPTMTMQQMLDELQRATARFLSEVLRMRGFAWATEDTCLESIGPDQIAFVTDYIVENAAHHADGTTLEEWEFVQTGETVSPDDEVPDWLRDVLPPSDSDGKE